MDEKWLSRIRELQKVSTLDPLWVQQFKALDSDCVALLTRSIDESNHSFEEWILALNDFWKWSQNQNPARKISWAHQIEYLNCCAAGAAATGGIRPALPDLFLDYVQKYGVNSNPDETL